MMSGISIADPTASATLNVKDGALKLSALKTGVAGFVNRLNEPLSATQFKEATFEPKLTEPKIDLGEHRSLVVKGGESCELHLLRDADKCLFSGDACDPVNIAAGEHWMYFQLATDMNVAGSLSTATGFGVSVEVSAKPVLATYARFPKSSPEVSLHDALAQTLSEFEILRSSADVMDAPLDTVHVCDLAGSMKFSGSFSVPFACNQLSLADEKLPFNQNVQLSPALKMTVSGAIALAGEFRFRVHRTGATTVQIGLYKKRATTLSVSFNAGAGLTADVGKTDLIAALFGALAPNVDVKPASLPPAEAEGIKKALKDSIANSLAIGVNVACSAATADEAAILYAVDVSTNQDETARAIDLALRGDWTAIAACANAKSVRNIITETVTTGTTFKVNALGIYNYESAEEFIRSSSILISDDGSVTITDKAKADWIAVASTPYVADAKRLRLALHQGFLATATWKALHSGAKLDAAFAAQQDFFVYQQKMSAHDARKNLLTGVFLGLVPESLISEAPRSAVSHARFDASADYSDDGVLKLFLADVQERTPRDTNSYVNLGRRVMAALLDSTDTVDNQRQQLLRSDPEWNQLASQEPKPQGPSYSDWYDITMWSGAFAAVGPALRNALEAADACAGDPAKDVDFMQKRKHLAHEMANAAKQLHAAFEPGWPMALCVALCGGSGSGVALGFHAAWNGLKIFDTKDVPTVAHAGTGN
ncbi:hypothetical protein [Nevskia soli]|jgi:hypothetical protein|uniref:hypothetical protein n=1 Tax=Nevskia soli TaxID=418856 RepID=UPI0015D719D0|nr:hypothetical protein [Nevskia soli]